MNQNTIQLIKVIFNKINKDIKNYNKSPKEILDIVAIEVLNYIK